MIGESVRVRGSFTQATLKLMQSYIERWSMNLFMVQLARAICSKAAAKTPADECAAIHAWVNTFIEYRRDPVGSEWVQDPFETAVNSRAGDCDDMAVLCGSLLGALGHPCRAAAVKWTGRESFSHAVAVDKSTDLIVDAVSPVLAPWPVSGLTVAAIMEA